MWSPLAFSSQKDLGMWSTSSPNPEPQGAWGQQSSPVALEIEIPREVLFQDTWDDDVSVLHDNPEEDDIEVLYLPRSTYDVLMPLFPELYIDDEEEKQQEQGDEKRDH